MVLYDDYAPVDNYGHVIRRLLPSNKDYDNGEADDCM